jgi:GH18 family chitinase
MSYDYHMFSEYLPVTGPNSPLYPGKKDSGYLETLNTNWSASYWLSKGMPREKINIGIPTYGHSFT